MTIAEDRKRIKEILDDHAGCIPEECQLTPEDSDTSWLLSRLSLALDVVEAAKEQSEDAYKRSWVPIIEAIKKYEEEKP